MGRNACGETVIQVFHFRVQFPHVPDPANVLSEIVMHRLETRQDQLSITICQIDKISGVHWAALRHEITEGRVNKPNSILIFKYDNE
jgi:hypothetical protein